MEGEGQGIWNRRFDGGGSEPRPPPHFSIDREFISALGTRFLCECRHLSELKSNSDRSTIILGVEIMLVLYR